MPILVVQIPPRSRLRAHSPNDAEPLRVGSGTEYDYVVTNDGLTLQDEGRCAPALLPKMSSTIAVLGDADVSWHRVTLPKAPAQRMRAALGGLLEEALLDEDVHLALAPDAAVGQPTWVAAVNQPWLLAHLAALEKAQVFIDRMVPMSWPDDPPVGHFSDTPEDATGALATQTLTYAHADGVATLRLQGGLARRLLPDPLPESARWTATPAASREAGAWLGHPITVMDASQRSLQATRSTWNLRQFELIASKRGMRALRDILRQAMSPAWRPVRAGVLALIAAQIVGLNLWAWRQHAILEDKRAEMVSLLKSTYPQVTAVLDAPTQMQRETESLRMTAGKAGDADLEPLLNAAASAWPPSRPPAESVRYEQGRLTLSAAGWGDDEVQKFRSQLQPSGWRVESTEGGLTLSRAPAPGRS
jgi:general secretion pathway protein L